MSAAWTINGTSVASLGLSVLKRTLVNQGVDTLSFIESGTTTPSFANAAPIILRRDGVVWFNGLVDDMRVQQTISGDIILYRVVGGNWWLEQCIFQQSWHVYDIAEGEVVTKYKSRCILGQNADGDRITVGAQITEILNYAISLGAPISIGSINCPIEIPWREVLDTSCAEAIRRMLQLLPNYVTWWTYSAEGAAFNCAPRLTLATVSPPNGTLNAAATTPLYNLQVPAVLIRYEQHHSVGSLVYSTVVEDIAGYTPPAAMPLRTFVATIELAGTQGTLNTAEIKTEDFPEDLDDLDWWVSHCPALAAYDPADITISGAARSLSAEDQEDYPKILLNGPIPSWLTSVHFKEDTITAKLYYKERDSNDAVVDEKKDKAIAFKVTVTDAATGVDNVRTYTKIDELDLAEPIPVGFAAALYAAWNQLHYDATITTIEADVTGACTPGKIISQGAISGLCQQLTEDIDNGTSQITIGPAKQLGLDNLLALRRATRIRLGGMHHAERADGEKKDTVNETTGDLPNNQVTTSGGETQKQVIQNEAKTAKIEQDPAQVDAVGKVAQVVDESGVKVLKVQYPKLHTPST